MTRPSRRAVLLGGCAALIGAGATAVAAVETDRLPGKTRLDGALGRGEVDLAPPDGPVAPTRHGRFASTAMGPSVGWVLSLPQGVPVRGLPLVLALHGRGNTAKTIHELMGLPQFLGAHVAGGGPPFAVASVDGGSDSYWHPRADGRDPLMMITGELLPRLAELGLVGRRIGVLGWSMGGYGALSMARESCHDRLRGLEVVAAAAASPALFASAGATSKGSFDGPDDWHRWGALADHPDVAAVPLHVSCGTSDPFAKQTRRYRDHVTPRPAGGLGPGRHEAAYWRTLLPDQLTWLGRQLSPDDVPRDAPGAPRRR